MEVKVCRKCRNLFNYVVGDCLCSECKGYTDDAFQKVSKYIDEHDDVSMAQVSASCNVAMSQIETWIKEERLHTIDEQKIYSVCESCGKPIASGNFCNLCKRQLLGGIKNAFDSDRTGRVAPNTHKNGNLQMRFLNKKNT